jgi:hypothetical protein
MHAQDVNGLIGSDAENYNVLRSLVGMPCSPLPMQRASGVACRTCFQPPRLSGVSSAMHWVNSFCCCNESHYFVGMSIRPQRSGRTHVQGGSLIPRFLRSDL